ncbi:hypothetical protein [Amycolatopsis sp.]|uniref:hypothetical protein n=1 Tax=Amycolatopsis sp. TaxID=37632 RepID=UPI002CA64EED|nr:hypothetical protein [Amycolatopsis sp.]HVV11496.1 hypothetical protein [Amycolatopsis sp.]
MGEQIGIMTEEKESTEKTGLKPAQIAASALAAVTAAFLGSTLGVAGTVVGAGIASVVTTVGGELYLRSLRRTRAAARKTAEVLALTDTRLRQETRLVEPPPSTPNPLMRRSPARKGHLPPLARNGQLPPAHVNAAQPTRLIPNAGDGQSQSGQRTVFIGRPGAHNIAWPQGTRNGGPRNGAPAAGPNGLPTQLNGASGLPPQVNGVNGVPTQVNGVNGRNGVPPLGGAPTQAMAGPDTGPESEAKRPWWKNRWTLLVGTSVIAFLVGMLVITGFEGVTGQAVSGGSGTTFGKVVGGSRGSSTTTPETSTVTRQPESSTKQTGSSSASTTKTQAPAQQTATAEPSASSSAQNTASATPTESAAPSSGP